MYENEMGGLDGIRKYFNSVQSFSDIISGSLRQLLNYANSIELMWKAHTVGTTNREIFVSLSTDIQQLRE